MWVTIAGWQKPNYTDDKYENDSQNGISIHAKMKDEKWVKIHSSKQQIAAIMVNSCSNVTY